MQPKHLTTVPLVATLLTHRGWTWPVSPRADPRCEVPSWSVQDVSVTYSDDDTETPGLASFNITNSVTHQHESLTCQLLYNTLCRIEGTPLDKDLHIYLQVNLWVAVIHFSQTWTCKETGTVTPDPSLWVFFDLLHAMIRSQRWADQSIVRPG